MVLTLQKYIKFYLILKRLPHILRILLFACVIVLAALPATAQTTPAPVKPATIDSSKVKLDSIKGDITTTIKYSAKDSIVFHVAEKVVNMYGDANVDYGDISLKAARTAIDYNTNLVNASGVTDSTGKSIGTPVFKQGAEMYTANRMTYNFKTKKGKISEVVTKQGEGFLHAEVVKRTADEALYGANARYTTCDLPHPHFYINAPKIKAIPGKKIFSGPFNIVFADIPTPVGFLFGYFPTPVKKRSTGSSGLIFPTFGETRQLGFYLQRGGYYFAVNENIGVQLTGDLYSFGSWATNLQSDYAKRYAYRGSLSASFTKTIYPDAETPNTNTAATVENRFRRQSGSMFWIQWSHSPAPSPGGKFSASVRAGSQKYNQQFGGNYVYGFGAT